MISATLRAPVYLGPEFNDFLYAQVGLEKNGMQLTVLSALARHNIDPWHKAAELTALPEKAAIQTLRSLIPALSDRSSGKSDCDTDTARLISLLPRHDSSRILSDKIFSDADPIKGSVQIIYVVFVILALSGQWLAAKHQTYVDNIQSGNSHLTIPGTKDR